MNKEESMKKRNIAKTLAVFCFFGLSFSAALGTTKAEVTQSKDNHSWSFTYFGTSTSERVNTMKDGASIEHGVSLTSCNAKSDGSIDKKGGKFVATDGYDGVSYYYTEVDPEQENFYLKAGRLRRRRRRSWRFPRSWFPGLRSTSGFLAYAFACSGK